MRLHRGHRPPRCWCRDSSEGELCDAIQRVTIGQRDGGVLGRVQGSCEWIVEAGQEGSSPGRAVTVHRLELELECDLDRIR